MKKSIRNLILFLILALSSKCAFCYTLNYAELEGIVKKKVESEIKSDVLKYSSDYKINITGIPQTSIITNENTIPNVVILSQDNTFKPVSFKRVLIKDSKNNIVKTFAINTRVLIYKEVLCANSQIPFNSEINSSNTILQKKEISRYLDKTLDKLDNTMISSRNYQKDDIILLNQTKSKSVVLKNSTVDIVFISPKGLRITLQGKALNDGAIGDIIAVRSNKYNKTYSAKINSATEVTVRI